jgi:hypothetical protein
VIDVLQPLDPEDAKKLMAKILETGVFTFTEHAKREFARMA